MEMTVSNLVIFRYLRLTVLGTSSKVGVRMGNNKGASAMPTCTATIFC